jgi:2-iminobutanoate/2-iminopropanoate deaminase
MKQKITAHIDSSTGAYSPGLAVGAWVFISGQGPIDMDAHKIVGKTITEQVAKTLENIRVLLQAANCAMDDCVKLTAYLKDISDFDAYNEVYRTFFTKPFPARTTVQAGLVEGLLVEIDAVAICGCSMRPPNK